MTDTHPIIKLTNVRFSWDADHTVLDIPDFSIPNRQRLFIKGPSGSGKSTLLGLIGGVFDCQRGSIEVLGRHIEKLGHTERDHFRANHIGFIFQMFNLIPYLSVIENVTLPCHFSPARMQKALKKSGHLDAEAQRLLGDLGLGDYKLLRRSVTKLSIGQQQRVAAARALIGHPELVIADEPTSALDTDARSAFLKLLFDECEREHSTLLFVSHDSSLQAEFDETIELGTINQASRKTPV